ncbi:MAG: hypothetical protein ACT6Q8_24260 [Niveispirillum sp.]|uniref:hypothetical protein n=1 Tax=Niveispirillum sp. TaxID=1917217 RepID=UPI004035667E
MDEINLLLKIVGAALSTAGIAWGVYSFLSKRIDKTRVEIVSRIDRDRDEIFSRLDDIRDDYLRRAEYVADRERMETRISDLGAELRAGFGGLTQRIDSVLAALASRGPGGGPSPRM